MEVFDKKIIKKELMTNAKGLGIPIGAAEIFVDHALKSAEQRLKNKKIITEDDLTRAISRELKKYNAELAYVYKNRDKIV